MKRIFNLFWKDLLLGIKDIFVILEVVFAVAILLLLLFVIPEDMEQPGAVYIYDTTKIVENFVNTFAAEAAESEGQRYVNSREELIQGMTNDKNAVGLIITKQADAPYKVELLTQPYTVNAIVKYVSVELEDLFSMLAPPAGVYPPDVYAAVRITSLQWGLRDEIPFNQRLLPVILLMMVGMVGLFAMISLVGQERSEGTMQAFKVSPTSLGEFLLSKHLLLLMVGIVTFSILYVPILGFNGYPQALLIIVLTVLMGSSVGVILGGIFDNPMSSILWVFLMLLVLALPAISLFAPVFSPQWLKLIPSYHTLFGLDAAMFPDNNSQIIWQGAGILALINLILVPLSGIIFHKLVRKEA